MRIGDLPNSVTACKADWIPGDSWLGFTPKGKGTDAHAKCQSTVQRQFGSGYVLEYVTKQLEQPNTGYAESEEYKKELTVHDELKGRLVKVHKLHGTARPLEQILGADDYKHIQDMWSRNQSRNRWSVAFPIVQSFEIIERPKANAIFSEELLKSLLRRQSATLRLLSDVHRNCIADLEIVEQTSKNAWVAIEDEFEIARRSEINPRMIELINGDLGAMEGLNEERRALVRRRAAWLGDKFVRERQRAGPLRCDDCGFDPTHKLSPDQIKPRSLLDVHHKNPLAEGVRLTTVADFALLCPTCHRVEHARLKIAKNKTTIRLNAIATSQNH
ncbi:HNH endonuclease [Asticcacaulis sp. YBE204]|uniref:HNH endonuclease n=1 Tax=Asticcacaulis sp. YBE204 TaxID=1282363 RepID=UPI0009DF6C33|nr:HNH endonuclease [Asticcacaulis sp. YBE204]